MKNFIFVLFLALFFAGCAKHSPNNGIINYSSPIFVEKFPLKKEISVNFTNTTNLDLNLTSHVQNSLQKDGFKVVSKNQANIIIEGNINYFRRINFANYHSGLRIGTGFGGFSRHFGFGFGFGFPVYDEIYESYLYDAQLSMVLRVKDGVKFKDYTTNLNYQSGKNLGAFSRAIDAFNYKIYEQIKLILSRQL